MRSDDDGMPVRRLAEEQSAALRAAPYTYAPVGVVEDSEIPRGFARLHRSRVLQRRDFAGAAGELLSWQMHSRAGLKVQTADTPLRAGTVVLMRWGIGGTVWKIPCRVVRVIDEPHRQGFSYGTLPGHPEAGEERFLLVEHDDGRIVFTITAVSRPAALPARLARPLSRLAQLRMTQRYLKAMDHP